MKEELKKIKVMNNKDLLEEFENLVRHGAGPGYLKVVWIRREILERMKSIYVQREEMICTMNALRDNSILKRPKDAADEALVH